MVDGTSGTPATAAGAESRGGQVAGGDDDARIRNVSEWTACARGRVASCRACPFNTFMSPWTDGFGREPSPSKSLCKVSRDRQTLCADTPARNGCVEIRDVRAMLTQQAQRKVLIIRTLQAAPVKTFGCRRQAIGGIFAAGAVIQAFVPVQPQL